MSTITKEFTKEQLQQIIETDHVQCGEASSLARIALASLEAEAVAWLLSGGGAKNHVSFDSGNAYADPLREVTPLYTAPPAPVDNIHPLLEFAREYIESWDLGMAGDSSLLASAKQAIADSSAQQLAPVSVPDEHNSVIAEQLAHVLSGMDVTDHQRAIINCAVDRLNKNAEVIQQKPVYSEVPEALDYQGAKELYNYLMNEEETNATVNGWNACRAAMLQGADGNSPDGWVACSERMPSAGEQVLAYRPDAPESNDPLIKMATYVGGSAHGHGFDCYCKPTHWMPLPAAPQQEA